MSHGDPPKVKVAVKEFRLCKFDGDPQPGDRPVEILVGGDGRHTRTVRPGDPDFEALCAKEGY